MPHPYITLPVSLMLTLSVCLHSSNADDWPQWMGVNRDGVAHEQNLNLQWSQQPPTQKWQADIGFGYGSVTISQGRVYVMGYVDDNEVTYCLDSQTGRSLWTHRYPAKRINSLHEGGPAAAVTADPELGYVYTFGKDGKVFCLKAADGAVVWQADMVSDFDDVEVPGWGFSSSPLIMDQTVIIDAGVVAAFDRKTGKAVWQSKPYKASYSSPLLYKEGDRRSLIVFNANGLVALNPGNGEEIAMAEWKTGFDINAATPLAHNGRIFISSNYGKGCAAFDIGGDGFKRAFQNKKMQNQFSNSVRVGEHIYGFTGSTNARRRVRLVCMSWETGDVVWQENLEEGYGSLLSVGDKLILLTEKGSLILIDASPAGYEQRQRFDEIAVDRLTGPTTCWTMPTLANGQLYVRKAGGNLVCFDLSPGSDQPE